MFRINKEQNLFLLRGYAGTGKTSITAAFTKVLPRSGFKSILLAPTGRAAKVISAYSAKEAYTIHKKIFTKTFSEEGLMQFIPSANNYKNTVFIVDEASMIGAENDYVFMNGQNLLDVLIEYVYSGDNCSLLLVGDTAQLPPVGLELSPAINPEYLRSRYSFNLFFEELTNVERQKEQSGILYNATKIRIQLLENKTYLPQIEFTNDVEHVSGEELEDVLNTAYSKYGEENVLVITKSNKAANLYNQQIRNRVFYRDADLCAGDRIMVVKNNYYWLGEKSSNFIANGEMFKIRKIIGRKELYGMHFAECVLEWQDDRLEGELQALLLLNTINTESPALPQLIQQQFFNEVMLDYQHIPEKWKKISELRGNPYYNAIQVKFSYAVTCHKSQGGQWPCVLIDQGYLLKEQVSQNYLRWFYTALTRATEKVYLINFRNANN